MHFSRIAIIFALLASSAFADLACVSGNLSAVDGTTCDIGNLQFTFTGLSNESFSYNFATESYTQNRQWVDSDFNFTVLPNGFELSGPGPQMVTAAAGGTENDAVALNYNLTDLNGSVTGVGVTGLFDPTATGMTDSYVLNFNTFSNGLSITQFEQNEYGQNSGVQRASYDSIQDTGPITMGNGAASPFELSAEYGDSASIAITSTDFTFQTSVPQPAPEPGNLILLGTGLFGLWHRTRQARAAS